MIRTTALWACLLTLSSAIAQEPRFIKHDTGDANEGLPIYTMIQDLQCMLWLGTANGLARYDGNTWHPIALTKADTAVTVTALFEDKDQRIWIGTSSGLIYYMDRSRTVHLFELDEGLPNKSITAIIQDPQGFIWFSTYGEGVYVYTGTRLYNIDADDSLNGQDIYAMAITSAGEVWLGSDDGINICTFKNETKSIRSLGIKDGLPDQIITSLKADAKGNVWIGTFEYGAVFFEASSGKLSSPFGQSLRDEITSFTIFDDDEVWVGTRNNGVWRYSPEMNFPRKVINLNNFKLGSVTALLDDVEGNIWITTEEGLVVSAFRPFESIEWDIPDIQTLFCDHSDRLWIGTKNGLFRIKENPTSATEMVRVLPDLNLNITDILEDHFQNIWIATLDHGLYIYHPSKNKIKHIGSIIKKGGITIMSMEATKKEIWLATLEGVVSYPADKNITMEMQPAFSLLSDPWQSNLHFVFQVFVDSRERTWFATDGNGVFYLDGDKVVQLTGNDSLEIRTVYSVCEDHRGHLWFNTQDQGLIEYDGTGYIPLRVEQGLGNMNLASVITAGTGDIIITHNRGIDLMEPDRRHFMYYDAEIALNGFEPGLNAVAHDSRGHIFTSGKNVIIKFYATKNKLSIHPRTQLTRVSVFGMPIDFANVHRFRAAENYFSFDYVGLWYTSPASVKYQYKLEGYDLQWKESRDNAASYSSLEPGNYTFYVKASENKFFLDEPIAAYSFTIEKPLWQKAWFIALVCLCSAGAFYWWVKTREKRFERQALLKKEMIESQLSALKAQINPHFLFNSFNTLITIIDENAKQPEVAIEYVEKLSDFYRSILQYREQESISLQEEWELVRNFVYLLQKRYGTNLRLHMSDPPSDAYIMPLTLQMLVENAVKHNIISEKHPLDLHITADVDEYVTVKNNLQPKSRAEPSTQFGLQSILKRYQLLNDRKVIIEKNKDTFIVRIPIIKKAGI